MSISQIEPKAMALRGVHEGILSALLKQAPNPSGYTVLDVGAGQGALSKRLYDAGFQVSACEFNKDGFIFNNVECKSANVANELPYPDSSFDAIVAAELIEHLIDQEKFFMECSRVLKPDGLLLMSTPNIASMKSRLQFFASGHYWSFNTLDINNRDGLQHVTARTYEQYQYIAKPIGFKMVSLDVDKYQSSSRWLLIFLPIMFLVSLGMKKDFRKLNNLKSMLGRIIIMSFRKSYDDDQKPQ